MRAEIDALTQRKTALTARFRDLLLATLDILDGDAAADGPALAPWTAPAQGRLAAADEPGETDDPPAASRDPDPDPEDSREALVGEARP